MAAAEAEVEVETEAGTTVAVPQPLSGLRRNYRCLQSLQPFYTGGAYAVPSDESFLACSCNDKVKLVDLSTASVRATLEGDTELVTALALSPDDKFLFSACRSRLVRVWEIASSKCVRSWKGQDGPVLDMACHSSGGLLATAGADKKVLVWDVDGGFCTHFFKGHGGVVTSVTFHPDPNCLLLFSGSDDTTVRIWNLETKKCVAVLEKHFSTVTSLAISESDQVLLSAGRDKVVNIWDLRDYSFKKTVLTYETLETVGLIHPGSHLAACIHRYELTRQKKSRSGPMSVYFWTVGERGVVRIWSSEIAVCLYEQQSSDDVKSAVILPFSQRFLCATSDKQFLLYNLSQTPEGEVQLNLHKRLVGFNEEITDMKFLGEEEQLLAVSTSSEQVRIYDVASMSCSYALAGHTDIVLCLDTCVLNSGEAYIITGSKDNTVRLWNVVRRNCVGVAVGHMRDVLAVAFSRKHRSFFVSGSSDRTIRVWSLDILSESVNHETKLKIKAIVAAHDKDINCLAVSPNDSLVCSGSQDHTACVWRLPALVPVVVLKGHKRGIWSVEFSPVDQCVITASGDRTIKYWFITDGSCLRTFEGHTSAVLRASFLTRGMQFVSCGADGLVKLWTIKTSECVATYDQHEEKIWALAIGKKTEMLATGGGDSVINLWHDCTAADKVEVALKNVEVAMKKQELQNAFQDKDYAKAIRLAFELRMPENLRELLSDLCIGRLAEDPMEKVVQALGKDELRLLFEFIREWNTKSQYCHVAQFVLYRIFKIFPPTEIIKIKGIRELLEGLIPYSQRHFGRVDRLSRSTFLLDYTLARMSVLEPETDVSPSGDGQRLASSNSGLVISVPASKDINGEQMQKSSDKEDLVFSKKRKSSKSGRASNKKIKDAADRDISMIPVQGLAL
uniref:Transducin beta-like protein 3 n=2 Tax=Anthurium amnicola TaxID=1678845 RepID=A0A1D1Y6Q1_9ARAE